jgi:hypothetical protein
MKKQHKSRISALPEIIIDSINNENTINSVHLTDEFDSNMIDQSRLDHTGCFTPW